MEKQRHADGCLLHTELKALKEYLNPLKRTVTKSLLFGGSGRPSENTVAPGASRSEVKSVLS